MTRTMPVQNKVDALLVLRGFACFCVVLRHAARGFGVDASLLTLFGHDLTWLIANTGALGVWIFFILSGYLMGKGFYTQRYKPTVKSSLQFYINRFLRIYPLYIVSIIVVWIVMIKSYPINGENLLILLRLMFFSYYQESRFPNSLLWTISTEFRFYLLVPFVFLYASLVLRKSWGYAVSAVAILALAFAYRYNFYQAHHLEGDFDASWVKQIYIPLHANLDLFLSGFLLNYAVQKRKLAGTVSSFAARMRKAAALLLFGAMVVVYGVISYAAQFDTSTAAASFFYAALPTLVILATGALIYQFESKTEYHIPAITLAFVKRNPWRLFEVFGVLTYGIYLWHMPVLLSLPYLHIHLGNDKTMFAVTLLYTLILSVAVSTVTYFVVEKPFDKLKRPAG